MQTEKGVGLGEAMEKNPTIGAIFGSNKMREELDAMLEGTVEYVVEDAEPGESSTTIDGDVHYFKIGNKYYELQTPDIEVEYDTEDTSFDHAFGTERSHSNSLTYSTYGTDVDAFMKDCTLKEVDDKHLTFESRVEDDKRIDLADDIPGLTKMTWYVESAGYKSALAKLPLEYRKYGSSASRKESLDLLLKDGVSVVKRDDGKYQVSFPFSKSPGATSYPPMGKRLHKEEKDAKAEAAVFQETVDKLKKYEKDYE